MGIKGLMNVLREQAGGSIREGTIQNYFGRKVAIDATMSIYQFLISIRGTGLDLTDESGLVTSHLQGIFYRTIKMMTLGLKPVYVFDGKPPEMKQAELKRRKEGRKKAIQEHEKAKEEGNEEKRIKFSKRMVKASPEQQEECKKLLKLMGIPVITSPSEAESQCAELVKKGIVYATGTEDMDALTFGSTVLLRKLSTDMSAKKEKNPVKEIHLPTVLEELGFTMDEFIDFCILCGCDYCESIRGIGPKKAFQYMKTYKSIERIIPKLKGKKGYVVPDNFLKDVVIARKLFKQPDVIEGNTLRDEIKWGLPDEKELIHYLVDEKRFDLKRVENGIKRLKKAKKTGTQGRISDFFSVTRKKKTSKKMTGNKRKRKFDGAGIEKKKRKLN